MLIDDAASASPAVCLLSLFAAAALAALYHWGLREGVRGGLAIVSRVAPTQFFAASGARSRVGAGPGAKGDQSLAALARVLAGDAPRPMQPTADGGEMERLFNAQTGAVQYSLRGARACAEPKERRLEYAEELKKRGNAAFKAARFIDAAECYAAALIALEEDAAAPGVTDAVGVHDPAQQPGVTDAAGGHDPTQLVCGQRVAMRVREDAQAEVEGIVCCENDDGTYDIILDDGSDRDAVPRAQIRPLPADAQGEGGDASGRQQLQHACLLNSARCAFQTGQIEMAVALATQAIDKNPANPAAFYVRGRARLAIPYLDLAKEDLRQAVLAAPTSAEYRQALSEVKEKIKLRNEVLPAAPLQM
jgi:tetratricopeptide (TPR) repeat protein